MTEQPTAAELRIVMELIEWLEARAKAKRQASRLCPTATRVYSEPAAAVKESEQ